MSEEETFIVEESASTECVLCGIGKTESLQNRQYCENCYNHLSQAYQWMQSPMLSSVELKKLQQQIFDLTDVQKIIFE